MEKKIEMKELLKVLDTKSPIHYKYDDDYNDLYLAIYHCQEAIDRDFWVNSDTFADKERNLFRPQFWIILDPNVAYESGVTGSKVISIIANSFNSKFKIECDGFNVRLIYTANLPYELYEDLTKWMMQLK